MFYWLFWQQFLDGLRDHAAPQWGLYDAIEEKRAVDEETESGYLKQCCWSEALPSKAERYDPNEEGAACINRRS
jgi:hypothetical protein